MTSSVIKSNEILKVVFEGVDASGGQVGISVPGLQVGDVIVGAQAGPSGSGIPGGVGTIGTFENGLATISVDDEIQQTSGNDLTGVVFTLVVVRLS
jgi:hypothetical protein